MDSAQELVSILQALPGAVQVVLGEESTWGLLKIEGQTFPDGPGRMPVLGRSSILIVADGALLGLAPGVLLLAGKQAFTVHRIVPRADESLELHLEDA